MGNSTKHDTWLSNWSSCFEDFFKQIELFRTGNNESLIGYSVFTGLLIGLSSIAHTHFALTFGIFIGISFLVEIFALEKLVERSSLQNTKTLILAVMVFAGVGMLSACLGLPYLINKAGIIEFRAGWVTSGAAESLPFFQRISASATIWIRDVGQLLFAFGLFWFFSKQHKACALIALLFMFFNFVHAAPWTWDQNKFFISLSTIFLVLWSVSEFKYKNILQSILILTIVPCMYELVDILAENSKLVIFSKSDLEITEEIKINTPRDSILAASYHTHKSPAVLSGRRLYAGYDGTLWSHQINFDERRDKLNDINKLVHCTGEYCPDYLIWTRDEIKKYKRQVPDLNNFERITDHIYKILK